MPYEISEPLITESEEILALGECVHRACSEARSLIDLSVGQSSRVQANAKPKITLALLARVNELASSALLLLLRERHRDGAVLALSAYELRLDAMYIAQDVTRAAAWLDHAAENRKPWTVTKQQRDLFTDSSELESEQHIYRQLSMVKHCNPVGGSLAFPISVSRTKIVLDTGGANDLCAVHLFGIALSVVSTVESASSILESAGMNPGSAAANVHSIDRQITDLMEKRLVRILQRGRAG